MKICVLGRGSSLSLMNLFSMNSYDEVFINNNFNNELNNEEIFNFVKDKKIKHFVNREVISILDTKWYKELDIECVVNIPMAETNSSVVYSRIVKRIKTHFLRYQMIAASIDKKGGYPTTGILSVIYAVEMLKATEVSIIGIDFYEANYYDNNAGRMANSSVNEHQVKKGLVMKSFLRSYIEKHPEVQFEIVTKSVERWEFDNVRYL